ncbi:MAG TPA: NFACT family protein [Nitrospirota bacterium]
MDFQILSLVVAELSALISTARVERVYQTPDNALVLILGRDRRKFTLLISPDRSLPRLHLVTAKPIVGDAAHTFALYLRSHLPGTRVAHIALLNEDRIVEIRFAGSGKEFRLVFELFGSTANLIFTDSAAKILSVYYPVPLADGGSRPLVPGLSYGVPEQRSRKAVNQKQTLFPPAGKGESYNQVVEHYYERLVEYRRAQALRAELRTIMTKALLKTERLREALSGDLRTAEKAEDYRRSGELVLANLNRIRTGMDRAELADYDGETIEVLLDPKRSPAQNAEAYFKRYKKAKAGREIIAARIRESEDEGAAMRARLAHLDSVEDGDELGEIRSELMTRGYLKKRTGDRSRSHSEPGTAPLKKVWYREWEILIGKSAAGNDYLTTKLARSDDLWLHAEGLPGSHVLVRNPERRDVPQDVLMKAASLAAFYSKGKLSAKVSVTYTRAGLVRKPKGAKPGLVSLSERRSLMVKPEDA